MVTYDYSKEPNNPWDAATWDPRAQIDFMRRMRFSFGGTKGNAEARIAQRMAQSDTKGMPPSSLKPASNKIYIIRGKPGSAGKDGAPAPVHVFLGFSAAGSYNSDQYFTLAAAEAAVSFPTTMSPDKSKASCGTAPTADSSFYLVRDVGDFLSNGSTLIATVTFSANQTSGTFVYNGTQVVTIDTALFIVCPHVADATIADVQITFCGDPD